MRALFWDLETTSLDTKKARIIELAASLYDLTTKSELAHYSTLIYDKTYGEISAETTELTGITQEMLVEFATIPEDAFEKLEALAKTADYWVAHNGLKYDLNVIKEEYSRYGRSFSERIHVDTRHDLDFPKHTSSRKLTHIAAEHGILNGGAHRARNDVECMVRLFFCYNTESVLAKASTPLVTIRADVTYEKKDEAKNRGYFWEPTKKFWLKFIREIELKNEEESAAGAFRVINLGADFIV